MTVIGIGNPNMGDDGVGVAVAERALEAVRNGEWPASADVVCAELDVTLAGAYLAEGKRVLVVDAVESGAPPGSWRLFSAEELPARVRGAAGSSHTLSLSEVLALASALGCSENLRVLGIQTAEVRPGRFLSATVSRSVSGVLARIKEEVEALP
jgi:hydrogenase maturation protease